MQRALFAALAAGLAFGAASASAATFTLNLSGDGLVFDYYTPVPPGGDPLQPTTWTGHVSVTTAESADGVYSGAALESVTLSSNWAGFTYNAGDAQEVQYGYQGEWIVGVEPGASVTLAGGRVSSIDLIYDWPMSGHLSLLGLSASADGWPVDGRTSGVMHLSGGLDTTLIPEPATWLMLAVGLGGLALMRASA